MLNIFNVQYFVYYFLNIYLSKIKKIMTPTIINVNKLVTKIDGRNAYTYLRVKNLLQGKRGKSTQKEIQHLRKILRKEFDQIDKELSQL